MKFSITDKAYDARATWAVTVGGRLLGTVSEFGWNDFRITDAGPFCPASREPHGTPIEAANALVTARQMNPAEQVDASGLMGIERDVLVFEGTEPTDTARQIEAARLGVSPTIYAQIVRTLRENPRAYALNPQTVERMRARHEAALARTARFRRQAPAALAQAS